MTSRNLGELYLKTHVSIEERGRLVAVGEPSMVRDSIVYVITAWNPGDERPTHEQNNAASGALHDLLVDRGLHPLRAVGAAQPGRARTSSTSDASSMPSLRASPTVRRSTERHALPKGTESRPSSARTRAKST